MSLNVAPEWCEVGIDPALILKANCPHCGQWQRQRFVELLTECIQGGYYAVGHIPPSIILTCSNPECAHCDKDFSIKLVAIVSLGASS